MARPSARPSRGFTLFELLVVLALLGLVAAFTIPAFFTQSSAELKATARTLAAGLRLTRNQALTGNTAAAFTLDVENRRFKVAGENRVRSLPSKIKVSLFTARSEQVAENAGAIRFYPDGSSTGGRITVAARGRSYLVDVDWLTGRVRLFDGEPTL